MLLRIFGYIRGYLVILISGRFPERFLNLCAAKGIYLWGAQKQEDGILVRTSVKAFRLMRSEARRSGCRIKIKKKCGLLFRMERFKGRKVLIIGLILFFLIIGVLESFIWTIRVDGNENMTDEEIKFVAEYCGLKQGVVKYKVNKRKFQEDALKYEPRLSWIYPEIKGTVAYIHVREKTSAQTPVDVKKPCNVIAKRSGVITKITVKRGHALVKEGDTVTEGQILISGVSEGFSPVHAEGEVTASWWAEEKRKIDTRKETAYYTGEEKTRYSVNILGFGMRFALSGKAPFESYEVKEDEKDIKILGDVFLPVTVKKTIYKETYKVSEEITFEEAQAEAKKHICQEFEENLKDDVKIVNVSDTAVINGDSAAVTVVFECEEDIALTDYIFTEE